MRTRGFVSLALLALLGCTERIQEGGFETSDLQAHVQRPDGSPVAAARVWLVRSLGDAAPAVVIDSTLTDTAGRARFLYEKGADLSLIGLDAQSGDSLGLAPSAFAKGTVASIALQETKSVQIGRDSTGALLALHVPGSHFGSRRSANGEASVLALPKGAWDVAFVAGTRVQVVRGLAVRADTVLAGVAGVKAVATDTITKVSDTLHDGPDIALDSFRVDHVRHIRDDRFGLLSGWIPMLDTFNRYAPLQTAMCEFAPSGITMNTRPHRVYIRPGPDSTDVSEGSFLRADSLPTSGAIAIQFSFPSPPSSQPSHWLRWIFDRVDSAAISYPGIDIHLGSNPDSFYLYSPAPKWDKVAITDTQILDETTWYVTWTPRLVKIWSGTQIFRSDSLPAPTASSGPTRRFRMSLQYSSHPQPQTASIRLVASKLYRPQ